MYCPGSGGHIHTSVSQNCTLPLACVVHAQVVKTGFLLVSARCVFSVNKCTHCISVCDFCSGLSNVFLKRPQLCDYGPQWCVLILLRALLKLRVCVCVLAFSSSKTYPLSCVTNTVANMPFPPWNTVSPCLSAADRLFIQTVQTLCLSVSVLSPFLPISIIFASFSCLN